MAGQRLDSRQIRGEYDGLLRGMDNGAQVAVNHTACSAGTDTRGRLYIKYDSGKYIAYCHNCSRSGVWSTGDKSWLRQRTKLAKSSKKSHISELPRLDYDIEGWPVQAKLWLRRYLSCDPFTYNIGWSKSHNRLVLPFFYNEMLAGYQTRNILPEDDGPKYLTYRVKDMPSVNSKVTDGGPVVIVEDIISSIKVFEAGYSSVALLSSNMADDLLPIVINTSPSRVVIWLDDDNHTVRAHQRSLAKRLGLLYSTKIVRTNGRDPKEHSIKEIKCLISQS